MIPIYSTCPVQQNWNIDLALCESCDGFYNCVAKFHISMCQTRELHLYFRKKMSLQCAYCVICVPVTPLVTMFSTHAMHSCILLGSSLRKGYKKVFKVFINAFIMVQYWITPCRSLNVKTVLRHPSNTATT